ncbi:Neuroendocrine protein 7B2 [Aphelenchoides fujianensis]|nr:Neuroendocrine protein 7B2 [Aphelenchoides fujianensis]
MAATRLTAVLLVAACAIGVFGVDFGGSYYPDSEFIDLIARDMESLPGPMAFGAKYISGGGGEGEQRLHPEGEFEGRQEVKSDNVLPAYCEPPNPCPVGYSSQDGCLEEFENTAEFSRNWQANQKCLCDHEHMFNCDENKESYENDMNEMLARNDLHKNTIAKKFHEKRSAAEEPRRKKRSAGFAPAHIRSNNPYLQGEPLRSMAKKDGRHFY